MFPNITPFLFLNFQARYGVIIRYGEILIRSELQIFILHSCDSSWRIRINIVEIAYSCLRIFTIILRFPRIIFVCIAFPLH